MSDLTIADAAVGNRYPYRGSILLAYRELAAEMAKLAANNNILSVNTAIKSTDGIDIFNINIKIFQISYSRIGSLYKWLY